MRSGLCPALYRKSPTNDDAIQKEERWVCDNCHTERIVVKEIPNPTDKSMLVKHLMSLGERYELAGMTVTVQVNAVVATFRFPEHDLPKLRERCFYLRLYVPISSALARACSSTSLKKFPLLMSRRCSTSSAYSVK
jgi:hypothetical protein